MKELHEFLVPDYYPSFSCKMGACRSACCEGWPISFSLTDYFKLVGVECSPELRRKLDCAMHLCEEPSPEAYAQITPRYDGNCPMRMEDGRCSIHAELGEDALAAVCRLYPRGVRTNGVLECSCANSCEAVPELLLNRQEPISFVPLALPFEIPEGARGQDAAREREIRLWCIRHLQDRGCSLPQRIVWLGESLLEMEKAYLAGEEARIDALLTRQEAVQVPEDIEPGQGPLSLGLEVANHLLARLDERSGTLREYGEAELAYFGEGEEELRKYTDASGRLDALLPQWETWFEHLLVNHVFFTQFPFLHHPPVMRDEFLGLCACYALLRFLCVGCAARRGDTEGLVDTAAMAFRLIDHTDFDRIAAHILRQLGYDDRAHIRQFLQL